VAYTITEVCIECGKCVPVCPSHAISVVAGHHWIDPNKCDDVAMCLRYCPAPGAIVREVPAAPAGAPAAEGPAP
jgi:ferredoxin